MKTDRETPTHFKDLSTMRKKNSHDSNLFILNWISVAIQSTHMLVVKDFDVTGKKKAICFTNTKSNVYMIIGVHWN